ncbi:hypothetical protein EYB53_011330 [Candidatus Chloroploca sp. M-50]|uniref:Uncharacterized protein n=1 Tax=Candidatus Chloroploca mongolica TaxID=2528176 RepID=A0ABS4DA20_9CHLR|nr:hypothetical protein [Candidatus Chloroploca mongolica]MBP1466298.1 hypothetical protein [Candidatus Chloroploca mongolica]
MSSPFAITTVSTTLQLSTTRQGESVFTVSNTSGRQLTGRARVTPTDPATAGWFTLSGESERDFRLNETHQYNVRVAIPSHVQPGNYTFHLDMVGVENPDEQYTRGPTVQVEVPANPLPPGTPFPWWIVAVIVGVLLLGGGLAAYLIWGRDGDNGAITNTPTPTLEPSVTPTLEPSVTPTLEPSVTPTPFALADPVLLSFDEALGVLSEDFYASLGVSLTTPASNFGDEVIGIVANGNTSACVESKSPEDRVLATGRGSSVGVSAFPIRATFDPPVVAVSVEFQGPANFRMRLFSGTEELETVSAVGSAAGTCGFPGSPRSNGTIEATASPNKPITAVIFDEPSGGRVFAIDNLMFTPLNP